MTNKELFWTNGIYALSYTGYNKYYIGITTGSFFERFFSHKHTLAGNKHHNKEFQSACNQFGIENLYMYVLDNKIKSNKDLKIAEKHWIAKMLTVKQKNGGRRQNKNYISIKKIEITTLNNTYNNWKYFFRGGIKEQVNLIDQLNQHCCFNQKLQSDWTIYEKSFTFEQKLLHSPDVSRYLFEEKLKYAPKIYNQIPTVPEIKLYEYT